ncbi:MAG: ComF family protein, partial [Flavobacteriales bacterium]|nr:ComF family protein [Flavobacteriales bacterium]
MLPALGGSTSQFSTTYREKSVKWMRTLMAWPTGLAGLFLPRRCAGCDRPLMIGEDSLCLHCLTDLPRTHWHADPGNPIEQLFWGKVEVRAASSFLRFQRHGPVQKILHRLKYQGDRAVGVQLGRLMAEDLFACPRFGPVDSIVPVPLHTSKVRQRGYNQSQVIVEGMCAVHPLERPADGLLRVVRTSTQTRKGRWDRWANVHEAFHVPDPSTFRGRHVLLVDDVVTTGAT